MILKLYELLVADENLIPTRFGGLASYVRHLAHVLNLIVKEILLSLKAGDSASATQACDSLTEGKMLFPGNFSALSKIRVLPLYVARSPQRRQQWKNICVANGLEPKFIPYDVETRWNSTYRMLQAGINATKQINLFLDISKVFPPFNLEEWRLISEICTVLARFDEQQISLSLPIYYELGDMFVDASCHRNSFSNVG